MKRLLLTLVTLAACLTAAAPVSGATPTGQRLRALAGNFLIGYASANDFWNLSDSATYQATAAAEFNVLTPENQMKFDAIHPQQTTYSFAAADRHVQFAVANNMKVHGHTLVWHSQLPSWVTGRSWTAGELTAVMNDHIDTVMGHFRGQIAIWDVVNEAFNEDGTRRASLWQTTIGQGYIEQAFRRARAADPAAALVYNDFNIEAVNAKSNAVFNMISDFKSRGVPIDGVGFQMHLTSGGIDVASLSSNMQRFANLGVKVYITEMDVRLATPASSSALQSQATIYRNVLDRCLLQPACVSFQIWGFTDKYSWVPGVFSGQGQALIFDENYNAKPAYFALQSRLGGTTQNQAPTVSLTSPAANASFTAPATIALAANAADADGSVAQVEFLQGGTVLATDTTAPYSFNWTGVAAGTYSVTARARDNAGATTTSAPVTVTVATSGGGGGSGGCTAAYRIVNQWPGGFQAEVSVTNGAAGSTSWTVAWTFANGQAITNLWNGVDSASGARHSVRNANYNGSLGPNAATSFGFTATWNNATNAVPALTCTRT